VGKKAGKENIEQFFYPPPRERAMPLSDIVIRNAQPKKKKYRISDGGRLYLEVYPNGVKGWRLRIKKNGRETMLSLGSYLAVPLKEARRLRDEINVLQAKGIDPVEERKRQAASAAEINRTFLHVANLWLEDRLPPVWSERHHLKTKERITNHLADFIGKMGSSG
jgi:hypothetical protein